MRYLLGLLFLLPACLQPRVMPVPPPDPEYLQMPYIESEDGEDSPLQ